MIRNRRLLRSARRFATAILAASAAGWLASGSCVVGGCYEDCDPCFQACQCKQVCQNPVFGENGLAIVAHATSTIARDRDSFLRVVEVLVGPSLEFAAEEDADGRVRSDPARIADFAHGVLAVNAELFSAERTPSWSLASVHAFPERTAVQFAHEPGPYGRRHANSVTFLFDDAGRLLEVTQVVDRSL